MRYFLDTSFFVALANKADKYHDEAVSQLTNFKQDHFLQLLTSDYVLDEFFLIMTKVAGIQTAIEWSYVLLENGFCNVLYCNESIFSDALKIFRSELGERKPLTLTDAIVYVSSRQTACKGILTFDDRLKNFDT